MLTNAVTHWKTTTAGILLGAITIGGVLMHQGVTLGNTGTGTTIQLIVGVATALMGILAKDN